MVKSTNTKTLRSKGDNDLLEELKKLKEELQSIRFTKSTGTSVAKLSKIKSLRRGIARTLTIINEKKKQNVISRLGVRSHVEGQGEGSKTVETTIKNIKRKHSPLDLRPKLTRAKRRALTKAQSKRVTLRQLKRKLNFPKRRFAVPL